MSTFGIAFPRATPGGSAPPGVISVAPPLITVDNSGQIRLDFQVTYPAGAGLGTMTDLSVRVEMPYLGDQSGDTSVNVPPQGTVDVQGPYPLDIVGDVVQNSLATIVEPAPTTKQTWGAYFYTSSKTYSNLYTDASTILVTFEVDPTAGLVAGSEWGPNPTGLSLTIDRIVRVGAMQFWRPNLTWSDPSDDPLFTNVVSWNIGLLDPALGYQDIEDDIITIGSVTPDKLTYQSGWIAVGDSRIDFILMVRPVNALGFQNSYVPGVTAAMKVTIGPVATLQDVTDPSVAGSYGPFDSTGKTALLLVPTFTPPDPAVDPTWANVDWWWQDSTGAWKVLGSPAAGGAANEAIITQIPTAPFNTNFLFVAKDANGLDRDGNASTDPTNPPAGTPTFGPLSIGLTTGVSDVTNFAVTPAYSAPDQDGKYNLLEIPAFTPPVSTQWRCIELWGTDQNAVWHVLGYPSSPGAAGQFVSPQIPTANYSAEFLAVSQDVNGKDKNGNATTPTGTCDTSGTAVHRTSGVPFDDSMNGKTFYVGITAYTVGSSGFTDADNLTLTAPAGTQTGASWVCPAQGTPAYGPLSITTPGLGSAGQEYAGFVTSVGISIGSPVGAADGSYNQPITPTFTPPANDTRWRSVDIVLKYASGLLQTIATDVRTSGQSFLWKTVAGSQTGRFDFVSKGIGGRNSIVDGTTPHVDATIGSTSQLDLSAAKVASFNQNQLRIRDGMIEAYTIDAAIIGQLQIGGGSANGTCNTTTSGLAVHALTGTFNSSMVHSFIWITGAEYVVTSYVDSAHVTVDRNPGNQSGAMWSVGMNPQFKVFDRSNTQIGFWGDDSFNTGFVGLFAGRDVRLGGTIGAPIFEVDSAGAVSIKGATFEYITGTKHVTINSSDFLKIQDTSLTAYVQIDGVSVSCSGHSGSAAIDTAGNLLITQTASPGCQINASAVFFGSQQIITVRQTGPGTAASSVGDATLVAWCNNLGSALRAHGLIT
jgi:hypothetical protein